MAAKKSKKKAAPKKKSPAKKAKPSKSVKASPKKAKSNTVAAKKTLAGPRRQAAAGPTSSKASKATVSNGLAPARDGVLIERVIESDRTPGGLYIPASATEKPLKGLVVSAGRGKISKRGKLRPLDVQPGDEVLFAKFAGTEIKIDGKEYLLIREDEILGVVS